MQLTTTRRYNIIVSLADYLLNYSDDGCYKCIHGVSYSFYRNIFCGKFLFSSFYFKYILCIYRNIYLKSESGNAACDSLLLNFF